MSEVIPGDIHPVVPKIGALIRVKDNGNMGFFKDWKNGKVVLIDGNEYAREDVEALVPAHYGRSYERAVGMPETGNAGRVCAIRTWRNLNPVVQADGRGRTESWHPNTVAALAPVLDPATETTTQKMARLEREMKTLSDGLHDRMVAEGEARQWCAEFDSILDSTGLPPRVKRNIVEGTMTFRAAVNASDPNEILDEIRRSWTSYINTRDITISEIHVPDQSQVGPRLS